MTKQEFYSMAANLIRYGKVSSVDVEKRTAQVYFEGRGEEGEPLVSGDLKVLQSQPYIHIIKEAGGEQYDVSASYATIDRNLGYNGESFDGEIPDAISLSKAYTYKIECSNCTTSETAEKSHSVYVEVHPWLPKVWQEVACLFLPARNGDGFILVGL